jgi:hypothetical protein
MTTVATNEMKYRLSKFMGWRWMIGIFIGAAIAGPICLLLNEAVLSVRAGVAFGRVLFKESESFERAMMVAVRYGFMMYLPFMWIHALATSLLARKGRDSFVWSLPSVCGLSIPIAAFVMWSAQSAVFRQFDWIGLRLLLLMYLPFMVTGVLVGLFHWCIAVWPIRQWRLQVESSQAAIRAME